LRDQPVLAVRLGGYCKKKPQRGTHAAAGVNGLAAQTELADQGLVALGILGGG